MALSSPVDLSDDLSTYFTYPEGGGSSPGQANRPKRKRGEADPSVTHISTSTAQPNLHSPSTSPSYLSPRLGSGSPRTAVIMEQGNSSVIVDNGQSVAAASDNPPDDDLPLSLLQSPSFADIPFNLWPSSVSPLPQFKSESDLPADFDAAFSHIAGLGEQFSFDGSTHALIPQEPRIIAKGAQPLLNRRDAAVFSDFLEKFMADSDILLDPKTIDSLLQNKQDFQDPGFDVFGDFSMRKSATPPMYSVEVTYPDKQKNASPSPTQPTQSESTVEDDLEDDSERSAKRRKKDSMTEEQKRKNHISSEKRRRDLCRQHVEELCRLTPRLATPQNGEKSSSRGRSIGTSSKTKSEMLAIVREYIDVLLNENRMIREKLAGAGIQVDIDVAR